MPGFETPVILIGLILIPLLLLIYKKILEKKKKQAIKFSNLGFLKSALGNKKQLKRGNKLFYLNILILSLLIIGLANPHIPLKQTKEGVNVILVLDVSGSMKAEDYSPNRMEAAKKSAEILIDELNSKDYVGIVTFETGATTAAYLSPFKDKVKEKLKAITAKDGKTAIGDGLSLGIDMADSIPNKKKVVILLSDGVHNSGVITPKEATEFAKMKDIQVHTIALGSEGNALMGYDFFGNPVYAEMDEATLQMIAKETGGEFYKSVNSETLNEVYKNLSENIKREKEEVNVKDWFIAGAILLFLLELYLRYGNKRVIQ